MQKYVETRRRGIMGWLTLLLFLGWNFLMIKWLADVGGDTQTALQTAGSEAERTGTVLGSGMSIAFILFIWAMGAVITGILAILFRGKKTLEMKR